MPTHAQPTRTRLRPLAVFAVAALAAAGCVAPHHGGYSSKIAHVLGFDSGCGCSDTCHCGNCAVECSAECPPSCGDITDSGGECCESGGCPPSDGAHCSSLPAFNPVKRLAHLPGESAACVTSCCTPNACPGPPDIPPPGRFHPVPTRPAFSPRFAPTPYGRAEF